MFPQANIYEVGLVCVDSHTGVLALFRIPDQMHLHSQQMTLLVRLSKCTIRNIKENLFWAFIFNSLGIPVAAGVLYVFGGPLLNPMLAGLAMSFSSVFVVSNALRLKRLKL